MGYKLVESDAGEFTAAPEGTELILKVIKVEERDSFFWVDKDDESKGKQREISFRFQVEDPSSDYNNRTFFGSTSTSFSTHPNCRFRLWLEQILQVDEFPEDFEFELEELEGLYVIGVVGTYPKKDGTTGNRIEDLKALNGPGAVAADDEYEPF